MVLAASIPLLLAAPACVGAVRALQLHERVRDINASDAELAPDQGPPTNYWPHARGPIPGQYGMTNFSIPLGYSLARYLSWSWHHPAGRYHGVLAGGPLIDSEKHIYIGSTDGVRKLDSHGKVQWHYIPPGDLYNEPTLAGDTIYGSTEKGVAFAVDTSTMDVRWEVPFAHSAGEETSYPAAHDGFFLVGGDRASDERAQGGNTMVYCLDMKTGKTLWQYQPENPVYRFTPLFPGDGTVLFMDFTGAMYRMNLQTGGLLWHAPVFDSYESFSDGGAAIGPNNIAYSCSNPGSDRGIEGTRGVLRAFKISDGKFLWHKYLAQPCSAFPAVGKTGPDSSLSVVITPGSSMGPPRVRGSMLSLDADTGALQWSFQAPLHESPTGMAKGDFEGYKVRKRAYPRKPTCQSAHWSGPVIDGEGKVYAGRSDGYLYNVQGPPDVRHGSDAVLLRADSGSTPWLKTRSFNGGGAYLHGAMAWAPGMAALATCDKLYVFKF